MMLKRRRSRKTDYRKRLKLLKSGKMRIAVRLSHNNTIAQVIEYKPDGDITKIEKTSKHLLSFGWKGHGGNLPAAYLVGFLTGSEAVKQGITDAVIDFGLHKKSSRLFAFSKGVSDAGINIPAPDIDEERIKGAHISEETVKNFNNVKKKIGEING